MQSMKLGPNLKRLLTEHDLTAARLSKKTGVPPATLSAWQSGAVPKDLRQVKKVSDHFHLTVDELCFGDGKSAAKNSPLQAHEAEIFAGVFDVILRRKQP